MHSKCSTSLCQRNSATTSVQDKTSLRVLHWCHPWSMFWCSDPCRTQVLMTCSCCDFSWILTTFRPLMTSVHKNGHRTLLSSRVLPRFRRCWKELPPTMARRAVMGLRSGMSRGTRKGRNDKIETAKRSNSLEEWCQNESPYVTMA